MNGERGGDLGSEPSAVQNGGRGPWFQKLTEIIDHAEAENWMIR